MNKIEELLKENPELVKDFCEYLNYRDEELIYRLENSGYFDYRENRLIERLKAEGFGCRFRCEQHQSGNLGLMVNHGMRSNAINEITSFTKNATDVTIIDPYLLGTITGKCEINDKFINIINNKTSSPDLISLIGENRGKSFSSVEKLINYLTRKIDISPLNLRLLTKYSTELFIKECYVSDLMKAISNKSIKTLKILYSSSHSNDQSVKKDIELKCNGCVTFYDLDLYQDIFIHDRVWVSDSREAILIGNSFGGLGMNAISFILRLPDEDLRNLKNILSTNNIQI